MKTKLVQVHVEATFVLEYPAGVAPACAWYGVKNEVLLPSLKVAGVKGFEIQAMEVYDENADIVIDESELKQRVYGEVG